MSTSVITGTVTNPSGTALSGVTVVASLRPGSGFRTSDFSIISAQVSTTTNASGVFSFTLERNTDITPSNTYYDIEAQVSAANGGRQVWAVSVGNVDANVLASLISTPPNTTPTDGYLTRTQSDARYIALAGVITTAGDLVYGTGAGTVARLGIGTAFQVLGVNAGATAPSWQASIKSILTTTGDIAYASAANTPARLAIGAALKFLRVNSAGTLPEWATATAADIINVAAGTIAATNVQTALNELDTEKAPLASPTFTGTVTIPTLAATTLGGAVTGADKVISAPELKDVAETLDAVGNSGTSKTLDYSLGNVKTVTLTGNCTFTISNPPATGIVGSLTLFLLQDGTGSRLVTWPTTTKWAGGAAPTLTTTATTGLDVITLITKDGGTTWYGFVGGKAFA